MMKINSFWRDVDIPTEDMRGFREWNAVTAIPLYEVHEYAGYTDKALEIFNSKKSSSIWEFAIGHSPAVGFNPEFKGTVENETKIQLVNKLGRKITTNKYNLKSNHHHCTYEELTDKEINNFDRIIELGAGCGDFAKFTMDNGFRNEYIIIDMPKISQIQQFNLDGYRISYSSEPVCYRKNTLFVSTWALSETPLEWRDEVMNVLKPDSGLIIYQKNAFGVDNEKYFSSYRAERQEIPWIPWDGGSYYLIW